MDCYDWNKCPDDCDICPINEYLALAPLDESTHELHLSFVEKLIAIDPNPQSPEGVALDWAARTVEDYEKAKFPVDDGGD